MKLADEAATSSAVHDAISLTPNEVDWSDGGWITLWVDGLSELADVGNVTVEVDGIPHRPHAIAACQINLQLRPLFDAGERRIVVEHRGSRSMLTIFMLRGECPVIKGFLPRP